MRRIERMRRIAPLGARARRCRPQKLLDLGGESISPVPTIRPIRPIRPIRMNTPFLWPASTRRRSDSVACERDGRGRAGAGRALQQQLRPMRAREALTDGQPEACTVLLRRVERLADPLELLR